MCVWMCAPFLWSQAFSNSLSTPTPPPKLTLPKLQMETDDEEEEKSRRDFLKALQKIDVPTPIEPQHSQE